MTVMFLVCMGASLSVIILSYDEATELIAAIQFFLSGFAVVVSQKLLTNKK